MTRPLYKYCEDWEIATLEPNHSGQVILEAFSGTTPPTKEMEYWGGTVQWLTPKEITERYVYRYVLNSERSITEKAIKDCNIKVMPPDTVMLTKRAPIGEVVINKVAMSTNQGFLNFKCGKKIIPEFLYYWFKANNPYLHAVGNGSTYPEIYASDLFEFEIALPSIEEQREITEILGALEDKIEINRHLNRILEKIAQAIFKYWFIDFEFSNDEGKPYKSSGGEMADSKLGEIPKGWAVKELSEVCSRITDGSHFSPKELPGSEYLIGTVKNMERFDFDLMSCKQISFEDYNQLVKNGCKPEKGDILFSKDGSMGITHYCFGQQGLVLLSSIAIISSKNESLAKFLYWYLRASRTQDLIFGGYVTGSALPRLVLKSLKQIPVLVPDDNILTKFSELVSDMMYGIIQNEEESRTLRNIQDYLLPKLMSGRIRVKVPK